MFAEIKKMCSKADFENKSGELNDLEFDDLVDRLTPGEVQTFIDDFDPGFLNIYLPIKNTG